MHLESWSINESNINLLDILNRTKDGHAQWGALEGCGMEVVEDNFLEVGLNFLVKSSSS